MITERELIALAGRKGFIVRKTTIGSRFWLIDRESNIPELNPRGQILSFSLDGAARHLKLLHDRPIASLARFGTR